MKIISIVLGILGKICTLIEDEFRKGGYLAFVDKKGLAFKTSVGSFLEEKEEKNRSFSQEKAERAFRTVMPSFETRDPDNEKWGGGIFAGEYGIGFSGLPELADEALAVWLAEELKLISHDEAEEITSKSGSNIYYNLKYCP
ncbi:MAG: hypothetical protein WC519_01680 [Parcubacteria group bacterium]